MLNRRLLASATVAFLLAGGTVFAEKQYASFRDWAKDHPISRQDGQRAQGDVLESFSNSWSTSVIGLGFDYFDNNYVWYFHEDSTTGLWQVDVAAGHAAVAVPVSAKKGGLMLDGGAIRPSDGYIYGVDFNGDLSTIDDNAYLFDRTGAVIAFWELDGGLSGTPCTGGALDQIIDIAIDPNNPGMMWVAINSDNSIHSLDLTDESGGSAGNSPCVVGSAFPVSGLSDVVGIDYDFCNDGYWLSDFGGTTVQLVANDGTFTTVMQTFSINGSGQTFNTGITAVQDGQDPMPVWVTDFGTNMTTSVDSGTAGCIAGCPLITLSPSSPLPNGTVGTSYTATFTATGGTGPYTYSISNGSLPPGLVLDTAGNLTGVPTAAGAYNFEVRADDSAGCKGKQTYDLTIDCPTVTVSPATLNDGAEGLRYDVQFTGSGGTGPYVFTYTGTLPPGMVFDGLTGRLFGVPTFMGNYSFDIVATDVYSCASAFRQAYTLQIDPAFDIVTGEGLGQPNGNSVRVWTRDGNATSTSLYAYAAGQWGTNVSSGDIDGGYAEILTGPGPGDVYGPQVRAFSAAGTPLSGVNFFAYGTLKFGVNVSGNDVDGDGMAEIISGAGPGDVFGPHTRGWNYDGATLKSMSKISYFAFKTLKFGVNVQDADVDGDGFGEILTGAGPSPNFAPTIRGWNFDNSAISSMGKINFTAYSVAQYGVNLAGADVDDDSYGEILTVPGPGMGASFPSQFKGYDFDNSAIAAIAGYTTTPFTTTYGGRVGAGDLDHDGSAELITAAGRDPAADATVKPYSWNGSKLNPRIPFMAFTSMYGVNVAAGGLGLY